MDMKRNISVFLLTAFAFTLVPAVSFGQDMVTIPPGNPFLIPPSRPRNFVELPRDSEVDMADDFLGAPFALPAPTGSNNLPPVPPGLTPDQLYVWFTQQSQVTALERSFTNALSRYNSGLSTRADYERDLNSIKAQLQPLEDSNFPDLQARAEALHRSVNSNTLTLTQSRVDGLVYTGGAIATGAALNYLIFQRMRAGAVGQPTIHINQAVINNGQIQPVGPTGGTPPATTAVTRPFTPRPGTTFVQPRIITPRFVVARAAIPAIVLVSTLTGPFKAIFTEGLTIPEYWTVSSYREKLAEYNQKVPQMNRLLGQQAMNDMRMARELENGGHTVDSVAAQKRIADQISALQKEMDSLKKEIDELEKKVEEINDLYERERREAANPTA